MEIKWKRNKQEWILDTIHCFVLIFCLGYTFRAVICVDRELFHGHFFADLKDAFLSAGINEIFTFIGAVGFVLFGIVGIYEFAYLNGLWPLVPPTFAHIKDKNYEKQAEKMMKIYYENDIEFIREYEKERLDYALQAAGIDEAQFRHIKYELIKARSMSVSTVDELRKKAECILYDKRFIVDQTLYEPTERVYKEVDYFINLYTAFYAPQLCADAGQIMANYIVMVMGKQADALDYIIIPHDSNLLLGLEVGKILRKPVVAIQDKERIHKYEFWDGDYNKNRSSNNKNKVIIIHDVLVTGRRIYESVERLPQGTYEVEGLYCLFKYVHEEYHPEKILQEHNICNINCLIDTDEETLKKIYKDNGKES